MIAVPCFGANVYIDPECGSPGDGSTITCTGATAPLDAWPTTISTANDYRQKCGTTDTLSTTITVSATGISEDYVILGAYYLNESSPVHEDASPSFGSVCGNAAAKPIIQRSADGQTDLQLEDEVIFQTATGGDQYLEFNSIHFRNAETAGQVYSSSNNFRYLWFYNTGSGLWLGTGGTGDADDNLIEYNHFDGQDDTAEDGLCNGGTKNCGVDMINEQFNNWLKDNYTYYATGGKREEVWTPESNVRSVFNSNTRGDNRYNTVKDYVDRYIDSFEFNVLKGEPNEGESAGNGSV